MSENEGDRGSCLKKKEDNEPVWMLWKKFRPKLWLLSMREKVSIRSRVKRLKTFLRENIVSASVSMCLGGMCYLLVKLRGKTHCNDAPYSSLLMGVQNGSVTRVEFEENSRRIFYNTKLSKNKDFIPGLNSRVYVDKNKQEVANNQEANSRWSTTFIDIDYHMLLDLLKETGTEFGVKPEPVFKSMGRMILTTVLNQAPSLAMMLLSRGLGDGIRIGIGRKPSKQPTLVFDDVEGVDAAKTELMEIVRCLQGDANYKNLGAKLPKGVLLMGPPGIGKTLLARAVAEKARVPFFIACATEYVELFVGRGANRIRDVFKEARKCAPSIIFIDELDAFGQKRGRGFTTEGDQTLNQLLTEMDGLKSDEKVVVIAATNRAEVLDPTLLGRGRFSRKVFVREPDEDGRMKILGVHFRGVPLEDDKDVICREIASHTEGLVGADLANIVNEAALIAGRRGGKCVSRDDIMEAVETAMAEIEPIPESIEQEGMEIVPVDQTSFLHKREQVRCRSKQEIQKG